MKIQIINATPANWYYTFLNEIFEVDSFGPDYYIIKLHEKDLTILRNHAKIFVDKEKIKRMIQNKIEEEHKIFYMIKKGTESNINNPQRVYEKRDYRLACQHLIDLCNKYPEESFYLLKTVKHCILKPKIEMTNLYNEFAVKE
jgi:intein-encoded DNA endonuclease-like protein